MRNRPLRDKGGSASLGGYSAYRTKPLRNRLEGHLDLHVAEHVADPPLVFPDLVRLRFEAVHPGGHPVHLVARVGGDLQRQGPAFLEPVGGDLARAVLGGVGLRREDGHVALAGERTSSRNRRVSVKPISNGWSQT